MNYAKFGYNMGLPCLLIASLLCGCIGPSKSPASRFYTLQPMNRSQADKTFDVPATAIIGIGPVKLPEYLKRPQIVTEEGSNLLAFAEFDRWGEQLEFALPRVISDNLSVLLPGATIATSPWNLSIPVKYQVIIDVLRLECRLDKDLAIAAQWSVIDLDSRKMLITKKSGFSRPIDPQNYSGLARTLSSACASLSGEIAGSLAALAAQPATAGTNTVSRQR